LREAMRLVLEEGLEARLGGGTARINSV